MNEMEDINDIPWDLIIISGGNVMLFLVHSSGQIISSLYMEWTSGHNERTKEDEVAREIDIMHAPDHWPPTGISMHELVASKKEHANSCWTR